MSLATANLRTQLSAIKDKDGQSNLLAHLSTVLTKLLLDDPKNAYDVFEDYSHTVKAAKVQDAQSKIAEDNAERLREAYTQVKTDFVSNKKLIDPMMEGDEENLALVGAVGFVPNFIEEAKWFEWAGVGFGEEESYRIFRSLAVLSNSKKDKNLKNVRLWGKIACSGKDYFIAEGQADFEDYGELSPDTEPLGGDEPGVNQLNYYVATDLVLGNWVELPPVTPLQVQLSRRIKYQFTGELNRKVITNPHFESNTKPLNALQYSAGTEKELLKCIVVRISYTCTIQPKGLKLIDLEADPNGRTLSEPDPDTFIFPNFKTLSSLENWVHSKQNILQEGKLKHTVPEAQDGEEQEEVEKRVQAKDPFEPLMKPLTADKAPNSYKDAWVLRTHGDQTDYAVLQRTPAKQNYGFVSLKNLYWPGAVTVYHNKKWQNLYIGTGFKHSEELYFPREPEIILEERPEPPCRVEPVPPEEKSAEAEEGAEGTQNEQQEE